MNDDQTISHSNGHAVTIEPTNADLELPGSASLPIDDFLEPEIADEDMQQILAQCYRIARERARKSRLIQSISSS